MAKSLFKLDAQGLKNLVLAVDQGAKVYKTPFDEERGETALTILRFGKGGVKEQFDNSTEYRRAARTPWAKPTMKFGNRPSNPRPLKGSRYEGAWLGLDPASLENVTNDSIEIGVDSASMPQVRTHQGPGQFKTIKAKTPSNTPYKDWAMRFYFGLVYGIWLTREKVRNIGMKIPRRRVGISNEALKEIRLGLHEAFGKEASKKFKFKIAARAK